jgi:3-oxoacyl-[acyl-carrier-protein] synthase II
MNERIGISGIGSMSALGHEKDATSNWFNSESYISEVNLEGQKALVAPLPYDSEMALGELRKSNLQYRDLDKTVLMGILAARKAVQDAKWSDMNGVGVNLGSSRGATGLFEKFYKGHLEDESKRLPVKTSPTTTLGNISSWLAQDVKADGVAFSHSITCSTAMHALANGIAWLRSGMSNRFLVGGAEAPLTDFTIRQMEALKIYSKDKSEYPCRPYNGEQNTMVLGEAAVVLALEKGDENARHFVNGLGFATEKIAHAASLSDDAECQRRAMQMAMDDFGGKVDMVITHAPGTVQGDMSELEAMKEIFGGKLPYFWSNKWKVGHTLGASGALSIQAALDILDSQMVPTMPYLIDEVNPGKKPENIRNVLVNSVGFGGNAVSVVIGR